MGVQSLPGKSASGLGSPLGLPVFDHSLFPFHRVPSTRLPTPFAAHSPPAEGGPTSLKLCQSSVALHLLWEARLNVSTLSPSPYPCNSCAGFLLLRLSTLTVSIPTSDFSISLPFSSANFSPDGGCRHDPRTNGADSDYMPRPESFQRNIGDCR